EAFQSQVQDFQKRVAALGELVQKRKKQLDDAFNGAQKQLRDALGEVIQAQMKEQGLNMVLPRAVVFEMSKEMDITQETLRRLNQRLPQVRVVISTN
ncbi:MAG: OmpH family outer membrane protein, partial [Alphaproteobacteria bacterium]|nr:OmpH family outer membrane protein [Alphaproteobacteria bacterium]